MSATLRVGVHATPLGHAVVGVTEQGCCHLRFVDDEAAVTATRARLAQRWPGRAILEDAAATAPYVARAMAPQPDADPLPLHLEGTPFQLAVWRALLALPSGARVTYRDIAQAIGRPTAVRAVGSAIGDNPVWVLVPCHRVLRSDGGLGGYAGGLARKQALLARELDPAR